MNKRDIIAQEIEKGGATKESLMAAAEVNSAGLSSQFTYLRLTGKYPVKGDNGVFKFVTAEEWESMKATSASRGSSGSTKTPAERKEAMLKRQAKLQEAFVKRTEAYDKSKSKLNKLKMQKASIEVDIVNLELDALEAEINSQNESAA